MNPLAIDLFCGLFQPEFGLRANSAIKQLVASRAENPNHVWLCVRNETPSTVTLVRRAMSYFENTIFTTGLAGMRHFWPTLSRYIAATFK